MIESANHTTFDRCFLAGRVEPFELMLTVDGVKGRVEAAGCADPVAVCLRPPQAARQRLHALLPRRHKVGSPGKRSR